jgi:hypothetical protein
MAPEIIIAGIVIAASNIASLVLGMLVGRALWKTDVRKW